MQDCQVSPISCENLMLSQDLTVRTSFTTYFTIFSHFLTNIVNSLNKFMEDFAKKVSIALRTLGNRRGFKFKKSPCLNQTAVSTKSHRQHFQKNLATLKFDKIIKFIFHHNINLQ